MLELQDISSLLLLVMKVLLFGWILLDVVLMTFALESVPLVDSVKVVASTRKIFL